ncbi:hypothetical protein [Shewanella oncorhynchi]|uniref:hypothetical protein n=1 Tax=Shewanella oncorhynchi TaxID=2726434 RepID=UPI002E7BD0D3|nr:hypothetical protein [Shewanella oncorhynchi]WVI91410.1 hypothetical protein VR487_11150 [Shewanella oncorhynchi]
MAVKPLTAGQKKVLYHLALALVATDVENQVIKPMMEKEGKRYTEGEFRKMYFAKVPQVPQVAQAERALQNAMAQAQKDLAASIKSSKGADNGK